MSTIEIISTILLNVIPVIVLVIPYFILRKKLIGKFYFRIMLGIMVFYLIYWVLPIIFQLNTTPIELQIQPSDQGNIAFGIGYIIAHFGSLIALFASYPLVTLPFIFFVAPFISLIFVWRRLRKEKKINESVLSSLTYEITKGPYQKVRTALEKGDWSREKEILKLLIVLFPISLYLLQVILKISGLESVSITTGETALGWFIEILFVYLATFIFSLELLFSSQIALKGRAFGESVRNQTYKSLYTVGIPISLLSVVLFVVEDIIEGSSSLPLFLYFFAYFIMASIIFVLFLKIFEPISLLIFIKIIDWWKNRVIRKKSLQTKNFYYGIVFGCLTFFIWFAINYIAFNPLYGIIFQNPDSIIQSSNFVPPSGVNLAQSLGFDVMIIFNFVALTLISLLLSAIALRYCLKYVRNILLGVITFIPTVVILSLLLLNFMVPLVNFAPETYWITGQSSYTSVFGFHFFTMRTASFTAGLEGVLYILAIPYVSTQYIFNIIIWTLIIYYYKKDFNAKNIKLDERHFEKIIFSSAPEFLTYEQYAEKKNRYLLVRKEQLESSLITGEREEVKKIITSLEESKLLEDLIPADEKEKERFYFTLKYLYNNNIIDILKPEFSYIFDRVEKQGLYIIYDDGRGVFDYSFVQEVIQDPGLVAGMVSAITSFIKETTRSQDLLKTIDHGDITIILEYGKRIFGALFIRGNQTAELRNKLRIFVERFEEKYKSVLEDWSGALVHFKEDHLLVEDIFKEA
ncbi:MAG: hypothetical protein EU531_02955 [Promethearchaeota archaeon]|nr:MAG: hypothetical protein EU531_02955 [Candidatus Lokiarchaeota archaeon]